MSINSCSIDTQTIDAICGSRRQVIINDLLRRLPQGDKAHPQKVNPNFRDLSIFRRHNGEEEENVVDITKLELPNIAVTVTHAGQMFTHNIDRSDQGVPLVNVYNVSTSNKVAESVNITDVKLRIL